MFRKKVLKQLNEKCKKVPKSNNTEKVLFTLFEIVFPENSFSDFSIEICCKVQQLNRKCWLFSSFLCVLSLCLFFDSDGKLFWSEWKKFFHLPLCLFLGCMDFEVLFITVFVWIYVKISFFLEKMVKSSFIVFQSISVAQVFFRMIDGRIEKMGVLRLAPDSLVLNLSKSQTVSITTTFSPATVFPSLSIFH